MFYKRKKSQIEIEPDEIFLDSQNIPQFNVQQFEGRLEKPITKNVVIFLGLFLTLVVFIFLFKALILQLWQGEKYKTLSQNISLEKKIIFANRGIIYDRNGEPLAWNEKNEKNEEYSQRIYEAEGLTHLLGYINYPIKDKNGLYWQKQFLGLEGIEKIFDSHLNGQNGEELREKNALGQVQSENIISSAKAGQNLTLTIDVRIQKELYQAIKKIVGEASFKAGVGLMMDVQNGQIIALTNYPEYEVEPFLNKDKEKINQFLKDDSKSMLNRAISGLYTPGSIVKPYLALAALNEGIIDPNKKILSTGSITIPNPYFPELKSIFKDWKVHGLVDMRKALAVSSNIYFYEIGGGFEDQVGLGIEKIEKYLKIFGLSEQTGLALFGEVKGIIPSPAWKQKAFADGAWRLGDTYNTAIGQYGFQITPIQILRAMAAIANEGEILKPEIILNQPKVIERTIPIPKKHFQVVKEGLRQAVTEGTAYKINLKTASAAAKTGSAQLGIKKKFINSWITGFFPYQKPHYAFVVLLEQGPSESDYSAGNAMALLLEWMTLNTPEYF